MLETTLLSSVLNEGRGGYFTSFSFSLPMVLLRNYMPNADKVKYSQEVPSWFDEIMCGLMLGDGNIRMNGRHALLSVQQTHPELVNELWNICKSLHLVISPVKPLNRSTWQTIYYFQTLTMPYFTNLRLSWYPVFNGIATKSLPTNINTLLTSLALRSCAAAQALSLNYGRWFFWWFRSGKRSCYFTYK